jgi:hypothetical protein
VSHGPVPILAERVCSWARGASSIRALFWYGGYGYGKLLPGSDLDAALLLHPTADVAQTANALVTSLCGGGEPLTYHVIDPDERRLTLWWGAEMVKLDAVFGRTAGELAWLSDARDVPPPRLTCAWPVHEPEVEEILRRASLPMMDSDARCRQERAEREIDKFVVAFESCSAAYAKGDAYSFYFQYNLALGRLARIVQLTRVGYRYLYLPRGLLDALSLAEQESFRALSGTLVLDKARSSIDALGHAFFCAVDEAQSVLGVRRQVSALRGFLERLQRRDVPRGAGLS